MIDKVVPQEQVKPAESAPTATATTAQNCSKQTPGNAKESDFCNNQQMVELFYQMGISWRTRILRRCSYG